MNAFGVEYYRQLLAPIVGARPWIVAMDVLVPAVRYAEQLRSLGGSHLMAIGVSRGVGEISETLPFPTLELGGAQSGGMMRQIRHAEEALSCVDEEVQRQIDAFDPERQAMVVRSLFSSDRRVGGRPVFGGRPASWRRLEDKMRVDALWDQVGLTRAPRSIVPLDVAALRKSHQSMNQGMGTVWVADNQGGWHGGGKLLRWVRTASDQREAVAFFTGQCQHIRVMPFLDGIPCSIHGWVFPEKTIALRPCEMLVFRVPGQTSLSYGGAATSWEPPARITTQMKEGVIRVGEHLRAAVGYRGSFTVDGVATAEGFLPTELNPRFGAALGRMAGSLPELPLFLLHLATAEGLDLAYHPSALQRLLVDAAASHPQVRSMQLIEGLFGVEPRGLEFIWEESTWKPCPKGHPPDATVEVGVAASGTLVFAQFTGDQWGAGPSYAAEMCALFASIERTLKLGLPRLEPALECD